MTRRRGSGLTWIVALTVALAGASSFGPSASAQSAILDWREVTLYFDRGSAELTPVTRDIIREFAAQSTSMGSGRIVLRGHTDTLGGAEYNMMLSRRRVEAVREALVAADVRAEVIMEAHGESDLARHTSDEIGEQLNRRVTISVEP